MLLKCLSTLLLHHTLPSRYGFRGMHAASCPACALPLRSDHVLVNKGIGGTTSGIFSLCAEAMLPPVRGSALLPTTRCKPACRPDL
jgi:hypothetical protein